MKTAQWPEAQSNIIIAGASATKSSPHTEDLTSYFGRPPRHPSRSTTEDLQDSARLAESVGGSLPSSVVPENATPNIDESVDRELQAKDSHAARLKHILDEPALRGLFREFLRANFCEENLSFWLEVQDLKRRLNTTSSAVATPLAGKILKTAGHVAMEKHKQDLIAMVIVIYNSQWLRLQPMRDLTTLAYLAPASPCELNIDHNLRAELIAYTQKKSSDKDETSNRQIEPGISKTLNASQLQETAQLYERIQTYIFRLMATDSVPKVGHLPVSVRVPC